MAKRSVLTKNPSATPVGRDMVYTGGSKDFNEVTGKYGSSGRATPAPTRLSPGVYRDSQGRLVGQGGRPSQQQPQRPPMQQQPPQPIEWSPQQPGQQGKGPARDFYSPLPQPPMGLKPLQLDYTGGTNDYNRMPSTPGNMDGGIYYSRPGVMPNMPSMPGNMGREAYGMQPDMVYGGGSADFDESTGRYRSGYLPPDRGMGGDMGYIGMGKQPLNNISGAVGTGLGKFPAGGMGGGMGMVDPRTMVGPQYDPRSIAFPVNNPSGMGGGKFGLAESIAAQVKARMAANAAGRMGQNLGNYQPGNMVPYSRKPIPG